ncbi:hypothetical protein TWF694_011522 [Orbilia ellipsospora]|uniref:Uncharacterized protein n=1 Tax=Orbilia ellipsospora TaxID=2528407 RepID=A0AAV9X5R6_9PEZI
MKYTIALAALTAAVSSMPTPPKPVLMNAGPFSLQIAAPGTALHDQYININPTKNVANGKVMAVAAVSKTPSQRFEIAYESTENGRLVYTPEATPDACKFFLCPSPGTPAGYDKNFGPVEYVRDNMRAMFFSPGSAPTSSSAANGPSDSADDSLKVWTDFQIDYEGFLTLGGESSWWVCPTTYPLGEGDKYMNLWWANGSVSDDRCKQVKVQRA